MYSVYSGVKKGTLNDVKSIGIFLGKDLGITLG